MISQFEDLPVWQDSRALTRQVYELTREKSFDRDWRLSQRDAFGKKSDARLISICHE